LILFYKINKESSKIKQNQAKQMSLYNIINGEDPNADDYYDLLDLYNYEVGRYRNMYLSDDKKQLVLLTRNGGGNREEYEYVFESLESHPNYQYDSDCDWDETYCEYFFSIPKEKIESKEEESKSKMEEIVEKMESTTIED
jgi:hypothetical protein